jgi:hypothetical protein
MRASWVVAAVALAGCGSSVVLPGQGGGGTATTSTSSTPGCPAATPASGAACSPEGLTCHYDAQCGGADATCTKGAWWVEEYGLGCAAICPTTQPNAGDPCSTCCLPPSCDFPNAQGCPVTGTCPNGVWVLTEPPCVAPVDCQAHADWSSCAQDAACRWLTPGCAGTPPPLKDGCYPAAPCTGSADCAPGAACTKVDYDPCYMKGCDACSAQTTACL